MPMGPRSSFLPEAYRELNRGGGGGYTGASMGGGSPASSSWRAPSATGGWRRTGTVAGGWKPPGQMGRQGPQLAGFGSAQLQLLAKKLAALAVPGQGPGMQQGWQQGSPGHGWNPWTGEYQPPDVPTV